jgi:hypothetical protein
MEPTKTFWGALWAHPGGSPSLLSRYTAINGMFYMALGAGLYFVPVGALKFLLDVDHLAGHEEGLLRLIGVTAAVIGWFYLMGGRTGAASFGLATVVDRLLVPVMIMPLYLMGMAPLRLVLPLAVLDPLMGFGAYLIWRTEAR